MSGILQGTCQTSCYCQQADLISVRRRLFINVIRITRIRNPLMILLRRTGGSKACDRSSLYSVLLFYFNEPIAANVFGFVATLSNEKRR